MDKYGRIEKYLSIKKKNQTKSTFEILVVTGVFQNENSFSDFPISRDQFHHLFSGRGPVNFFNILNTKNYIFAKTVFQNLFCLISN